uniref:hypothetical protein n=1 Tax=Photorhabdus sp. RM322S TaxID=3342825 RepID=UPI0036DC6DC2
MRHPIERLPNVAPPVVISVLALLGAERESGEGGSCLHRKNALCNAGDVVLGASGVSPGRSRTHL